MFETRSRKDGTDRCVSLHPQAPAPPLEREVCWVETGPNVNTITTDDQPRLSSIGQGTLESAKLDLQIRSGLRTRWWWSCVTQSAGHCHSNDTQLYMTVWPRPLWGWQGLSIFNLPPIKAGLAVKPGRRVIYIYRHLFINTRPRENTRPIVYQTVKIGSSKIFSWLWGRVEIIENVNCC